MSFGYKTAWIAARSTDAARVIRALDLRGTAPSTGEAGVDASYEDHDAGYGRKVFVTRPIDGWTLAVSTGFFRHADDNPPSFGDWIARLSAELGCEVQYFSTHRVVETHCWARAVDGELQRAYGYSGASGEVMVDFGEKTEEEAEDLSLPDEGDVMTLAGQWSVDPSVLADISDGFLGQLTDGAPSPSVAVQPAPRKAPWWKFW
jgi:hypothetical protein